MVADWYRILFRLLTSFYVNVLSMSSSEKWHIPMRYVRSLPSESIQYTKCHCFCCAIAWIQLNLQFKYRIHSERTNGRILWSFIVFNSVWYTFGTMKMISCIKLITNRIRASGWQQFAMTFHQNKTNIIGLCSVFF